MNALSVMIYDIFLKTLYRKKKKKKRFYDFLYFL